MFLILLAILLFGIQPVAMKKIPVSSLRVNILQTGTFSGVIAVCFWIWGIISGIRISSLTFWYGILFGAVLVATISCYYYAMHTGPLSYTSFFYSASMVIPSLAGVLIWNDEFRWTAGVGIVMFLAAFYLISVPGSRKSGGGNRKWLLLCLATWLLNGSLSVIVKAQQMAMEGEEVSSMTTVAFSSAFVFSFAAYFILTFSSGKSEEIRSDFLGLQSAALPLLALAAGNGGGNLTVTYLASRVSSAYLYPAVLGGMMVAVTAYSVLALKEKVNRYGIAGLLTGIAALVVLNIP